MIAQSLNAKGGAGRYNADETLVGVPDEALDRQTDSSIVGTMQHQAHGGVDTQLALTGYIVPVLAGGCHAADEPGREGAERHEALGESTGFGIGEDGDPGFTLQAGHSHAVAIRTAQTSANGHGVSEDVSHTLDGAQGQAVMALAIRGRGESRDLESREDGTSNAILTPNGGRDGMGVGAVLSSMAVRRLLPEECEALQGFPRGYTKISDKTADGPRYKALGNSMAVPCMRWIGECIQKVEDSL